ncbi:PAS domain-containing sensor histidine kinase [Candidatus Thorarchaeota archaeon]|nr:MAG: PAS domain-containing sensor histidine kinase [Candidatus Thorarchaeota archaeon]
MPTRERTSSKKKTTEGSVVRLDETIPLDGTVLESILQNTHSGIAIVGEDFTLEYVNEQGCRIFGGSQNDLIGQDFRKFIEKDSLNEVIERYQKRRRGENVPAVYPFHMLTKNGNSLTIEGRVDLVKCSDGKIRTIAHFLDISQIERAQELLEESQRRYRILVETMNDGLVIDNEQGILTYANDAFYKMLNYTSEEIIGKVWSTLTPDLDVETIRKKIEQRRSGVSERYELNWLSSTGELVPTIVSATPLHNRAGEFIGTFAIITEISAQKDAEETIQFYLDLLSHDIANQLQVIMTSTGLLEEEVPASYIDDARKDILDAVDRCNRLITKVKRAGQIRQIPLTNIDLIPVVDEKAAVLERVYDAKIHREGLKKSIMVEADVLLGELVWNLLENAARHNPTENKEIWIVVKAKGPAVMLSIADNGPGLSDARKEVIFTERKYGSGVGLRLVQQMIRKYAGSIDIEDRILGKPSEGAKFVVTLRKAKNSR